MPLSPEWANLPRRRCDDCGKTYKPVRPRRPGEMGFCSDNCRKSYHKHGGAYRKLRAEVRKMLQKEVLAMRQELNDFKTQLALVIQADMPKSPLDYYKSELANAMKADGKRKP